MFLKKLETGSFRSIPLFFWAIRASPLILIFSFAIGCSQKPGFAKKSNQQFFQDVSQHYLPRDNFSLHGASFAKVDRKSGVDIIGFTSTPGKGAMIIIMYNKGKDGFGKSSRAIRVQKVNEDIKFLAVGDVNNNGVDDLVLITSPTKKGSVKILLNNGKGYFFSKHGMELPLVHRSVEHVDLVDLDQDGDIDLIFTGSAILNKNGKLRKRQGQILINNGRGQFEDETALLWPNLPAGIVGTSIADYDNDGLPDIFLVYENGQNRLLMNNGVGQFADKTDWLLPRILDQSTHADWADFDLDGDNDLLVTNMTIKKRYQAHSREVCYFLENDGDGRFLKRSGERLPSIASFRVYLLDANGTGIPDIIILKRSGLHYMIGRGKWDFSVETNKRFPETSPMKEIKFGDVNGDGFLDLLGITANNNNPKLWLNRLE